MIEIVEVAAAADVDDLRRDYLASLRAPQDGMWEAFAAAGRQLEIRAAGKRAGYLALDGTGHILQFHLAAPFERDAGSVFAAVTARDDVHGAMVSTADPLLLGLCLDRQRSVRVHTYLYRDHRPAEPAPALANGAAAVLEVVEPGELEAIAALQRASLDQDPGDWLVGYLEGLIERRELHALRLDGETLGTGEARVSSSQPPYVDLGVITMRPHRRRGVTSHILGRLRQRCHDHGLEPICSTTVENVGARRAIERAGFLSRHRLLEIAFRADTTS
jgi:GNAT superfamily N-acetyltransferase